MKIYFDFEKLFDLILLHTTQYRGLLDSLFGHCLYGRCIFSFEDIIIYRGL
jgi:hypothetical protein